MLSFLRQDTPRTRICHESVVTYEGGRSSITFFPRDSRMLMRITFPPGPSIIVPPLHFHQTQDEEFNVVSGTMRAVVSGNVFELSEGRSLTVPRKMLHKFENASSTAPCTVELTLEPRNFATDERFFRNFYTYLDDCNRLGGPEAHRRGGGGLKTMPNLFQLLLFLYEAGTVLAIPLLPRGIADPLGRGIGWVGGVLIGKYLLGLQASYPEYYREKDPSKKGI